MQGKPVFRRLQVIGVAAALGLTPLTAVAQAPATPAQTTPAQPSSQSTPAPPKAPATPDKAGTPPGAAPATPEPKTSESKTSGSETPTSKPQDSKTPDSKKLDSKTATPPGEAPNTASPKTPPGPLAPGSAPQTHEVEPNGAPQTPSTATMETIEVPARPIAYVEGQSSYDDAFKSIKASLAKVKAAMDKAGLKPSGHPITIFVDTDDKGFKYKAAIPIAERPAGKSNVGDSVALGDSPAGSGLKFRHRGPFDEIDSTYDLIVAYLDEKGLQIDPPYIEEYLDELTTPDDPKLEVDIYTFIRK